MEDMFFFESEIIENDDTAPVATLIKKGSDIEEFESDVIDESQLQTDISKIPVAKAVDDIDEPAPIKEEPVADSAPIEEAGDEAPIDEPVEEETPIEEEIAEEPIEDEVTEEPIAEEAVEESIIEDEIAEEENVEEEPIVEEAEIQEEAEDNTSIVDEQEQAIENNPFIVDEEPTEEPTLEEPTAEEVAEETSIEEEITEEPVVDEIPEEPIVEEAPIEEKIAEEPIEDEVAEEPIAEEGKEDTAVSLKESMALATATKLQANDNTVSMSKKVVYDYLHKNYKDITELSQRENYTKTGLPLADTHYDLQGKKKVCFIYVYELNESVLFLIRANEKVAKEIKEKHNSVVPSAFPKSAQKDWYTMVLDDSFKSNEDVYEVLDMLLGKKKEIVQPVEVKPVKKPVAKKKVEEVKVEEPVSDVKSIKTKKGMSLSVEDKSLQKALKDSQFTVQEEKPVVISKKKETEDIWAVASIVKQKETKPTKPIIRKAAEEKPVEEKPAKKATSKKSTVVENIKEKPVADKAAKNIKLEETKVATKETEEKVLVEADLALNPNPGKFVIKKTDKGNFVYKLFSFNKRVVAIGAEPYADLASCKNGIKSVEKNAAIAPIEDQTLKTVKEEKCPKWIVYQDKKGEFRLRLIASNGNIVATTNDGYTTKTAAKQGIEAIGRAAKGAFVVRNDDLW